LRQLYSHDVYPDDKTWSAISVGCECHYNELIVMRNVVPDGLNARGSLQTRQSDANSEGNKRLAMYGFPSSVDEKVIASLFTPFVFKSIRGRRRLIRAPGDNNDRR
jgi:hypothetical protein